MSRRAASAVPPSRPLAGLVAMALLVPAAAGAHSFGRVYNLPVPIWLYLYGAAAALLLSFLLVAYFVTAPVTRARRQGDRLFHWREYGPPRLRQALRLLGVAGLLLTIATGLFGRDDPYQNFSMTFFWIVFVLGFSYLVALLGDLYALMNPWRTIADGLARLMPGLFEGRRPYPAGWFYAPALLLYMAFIWVELFARTRPFSMALFLLGYGAIMLLGAWRYGSRDWFRYGDFFAVFFRLIARCSPLAPSDGTRRPSLQQPFMGLAAARADHPSLLLFVLFMLSSTAFDGLRETVFWVGLYWRDVFTAVLPHLGGDMAAAYPAFQAGYAVWQTLALIASPFVYLAIYLAFLRVAKHLTGSARPVRELALDFAFSLIPIALVYHLTHYYTLLLTQGVQILRLASDPFGFGWNLFGTRGWFEAPITLDAGAVWHTQVWLILFGHIVSVYLAHLEALRVFGNRRDATLSQLPILILMVLFTSFGLWVLSQPISTTPMG